MDEKRKRIVLTCGLVLLAILAPVRSIGAGKYSGGVTVGGCLHNGTGVENLRTFGVTAGTYIEVRSTRNTGLRLDGLLLGLGEGKPDGDHWNGLPALGWEGTGGFPPEGEVRLLAITADGVWGVEGSNSIELSILMGVGVYHPLEYPGVTRDYAVGGNIGLSVKFRQRFPGVGLEVRLHVVDWAPVPMVLLPMQIAVSF